jgi:hypothetical protein
MSLSRLTNQPSSAVPVATPGDAVVSFLGDCYPEDWERLERYAARRRFSAGEGIVRQGDAGRVAAVRLRRATAAEAER